MNKDTFYQSKYDYYRNMNYLTVIISVFANCFYWISDCQLFGRIALETLIPRTFMILPLMIFLIIHKKIDNYKIMIPISYLMLHGIMWCTIWAIYYLPIKQHANEGFIIMHLMFLALGFSAPKYWSIFFHSLVIVNILVSYPINHYESLDLMLSLGLPCLIAIELMLFIIEKTYSSQYSMQKELEDSLLKDKLTYAYNRNIFDNITKDTELTFDEAGICLLDIDLFKTINDDYGHDLGDEVLKSLVKIIKKSIRSSDYLIRWGGEEFVLILPNQSLQITKEIAERIRKVVEDFDEFDFFFTISIGVSHYHQGDNYQNTIKNADVALYFAKDNGRNQTVAYEEMFIED